MGKKRSSANSKDLASRTFNDDGNMVINNVKPAGAANLADPILLDKIDRLFACNVGHHIDLPQLVVVGDQSSGKSSVLEGLTGLPFPRDSGLCTRFATQIVFKRAPKALITVSIIPSKEANTEHSATVSAWKKDDIKDLDAVTFAGIVREVQHVMGVGEGGVTFTNDVLKLELSGPDREHLSIVDVPGIFRKATEGKTTEQDMKLVRAMVLSYMKNPRSVMLAVIPANVDTATQEILSMAKDLDANGERTMGILTKPDLVDDGAEPQVVELMEGYTHRLALGWHMVRNLSQKQLSDMNIDRHAIEQDFFETENPWCTLPKDAVGVPSLQIRLQEVLNNHVKAEFPKVRNELSKRLKDKKTLMEALGRRRDTTSDQAQYLMEMATSFTDILTKALSTMYGSEVFDEHPALKLPTLAVTKFDSFNDLVLKCGHLYQFDCCETCKDPQGDTQYSRTRDVKTPADLEDLLVLPDEIAEPWQTDIFSWLRQIYETSRGFELGTFQTSILPVTMREQSKKWNELGLGFISDIACLVHEFILTLLEHVCPDKSIRGQLLSALLPELLRRYSAAIDYVKFILSVERDNPPITANKGFMAKLQQSRSQRQQDGISNQEIDTDLATKDPISFIVNAIRDMTMSNTEQIVREIHDITKSYYEIAVQRFIDSVCQVGAGNFLIHGPDSPLRLFSPRFVSGLTDQQLSHIAGEDAGTRRKRALLDKEIADLEEGRKILFSV